MSAEHPGDPVSAVRLQTLIDMWKQRYRTPSTSHHNEQIVFDTILALEELKYLRGAIDRLASR